MKPICPSSLGKAPCTDSTPPGNEVAILVHLTGSQGHPASYGVVAWEFWLGNSTQLNVNGCS